MGWFLYIYVVRGMVVNRTVKSGETQSRRNMWNLTRGPRVSARACHNTGRVAPDRPTLA